MADGGDALNCTPPSGSIRVDSDIVGGGVLAAFFISALFTIGAVIFGYLSGSLGDELVDDLDREKIAWLRQKLNGSMASIWRMLSRPEPATADHPNGEPDLDRDVRRSRASKKAITQFILALSDQQLVTGFAILISGVANQKRLTLYEFSVVASLAWFSSTTHLATLGALQHYLRANRVVRNLRVLGMAVMLILLLYASFITVFFNSSNTPNTVPIQCFFTEEYGGDATQDIGVKPYIWVLGLYFIIPPYAVRIFNLYFDFDILDLDVSSLLRCPPRPAPRKLLLPEMGDGFTPTQQLIVYRAERRTGSRRRLLELMDWGSHLKLMAWSSLDSKTPLTSSSASVAFSLAYGISQVINTRWTAAPQLDEDANYIGFGQFMSLFLLALPFFAAVEFYYDYTENSSQLTGSHCSFQRDIQGADRKEPVESHQTSITFDGTVPDGRIVNSEYLQHHEDIARYLPAQAYMIHHLAAQPPPFSDDDRKSLETKVESVLKIYKQLKTYRLKPSINRTLVISSFGYMLLLATCGALLNSSMFANPDDSVVLFAFSFLFPGLVLGSDLIDLLLALVWWPLLQHGRRLGWWTWFIRGQKNTRRQADAAKSAEGSQTLRRTGTTVVEEGRVGEERRLDINE